MNMGTDWTIQKYPKLEYFKWYSDEMKGLTTFLELSPNIHTFGTFADYLWLNSSLLMSAKFSLNTLMIVVLEDIDFNLFVRLLNRLNRRGVYKRLYLHLTVPDEDTIRSMSSINALVGLRFLHRNGLINQSIDMVNMKNLEDLFIDCGENIIDMDAFTMSLTKLKHIKFCFVNTFEHIVQLISRAANLKTISVRLIRGGNQIFNEETNVINLLALKKIREKLVDAKKLTLYVHEKVYLASKWAFKMTDFGSIRVKRWSSYDLVRV